MTPTISSWEKRPWNRPWSGNAATVAEAEAAAEIGIGRGMCYGPCPVYTVTLLRSGEAHYVGEHFVDLIGPHVARIDPRDFEVLALAFEHLGFRSLAPHYEVAWTDMSTTTTWVVTPAKRIEVRNYGNAGPEQLRLLEDLVDAAASELAWQPEPGLADVANDGRPLFVGLDADETWRPAVEDHHRTSHWTQGGGRRSK